MDDHSEASANPDSKDGAPPVAMSAHLADDLLSTTAVGWRSFYDKLSRRLEDIGVADSSFFLNYGYLPIDSHNESAFPIRAGTFNVNSVRLVFEVVGSHDLNGSTVVEIGCGRGGNSALVAEKFDAQVIGIDMSAEAIAFCSKTHVKPSLDFKVGDALNIPLDDAFCDAVINIESSHSYGNLPKFLKEVRRICRPGAWFLHTDFLSPEDWDYVRTRLKALGFVTDDDRDITANVLASRDQASNNYEQVYGDGNARVANFLALPGSAIYEQMRAGLLEYRILRSQLRAEAT
ncbi:class I SAM-dependent methyltransferase [Mycobacterium helveticum]|uniref:Methyltransferase domain-containing protein n=1 Tax=Mycobacterium helveticum TaxID=2592811 RepID=A0A557XRL4_9MYCO|nr:class I SAM-dependent methyltransferase [Mycobacterium helveticum]TVS87128.1 methyltransferase domain-containing protein [Mycobacterium helveticum]TVS88579.1 methyltransferase domain-containing protein [Mycobacterium helveticum]